MRSTAADPSLEEPLLPQASSVPSNGVLRAFRRGRATEISEASIAPPPHGLTRRVSFGAEPVMEQMVHLLDEDEVDIDDSESLHSSLSMHRPWPIVPLRRAVLSVVLGGIVGMVTYLFLTSILCGMQKLFDFDILWSPPWLPSWLYTMTRGVLGGAVAGSLLWYGHVTTPLRIGTNGWIRHRTVLRTEYSWCSQGCLLASSWVAIVVIPAPLGPEWGLALVAQRLAKMTADIETTWNGVEDTPGVQENHSYAWWRDVAVAAVVGASGVSLPTAILLGPLLVMELAHEQEQGIEVLHPETALLHCSGLWYQMMAVVSSFLSLQSCAMLLGSWYSWQDWNVLPNVTAIPYPVLRDWTTAVLVGVLCGTMGAAVHVTTRLVDQVEQAFRRTMETRTMIATIAPLVLAGFLMSLMVGFVYGGPLTLMFQVAVALGLGLLGGCISPMVIAGSTLGQVLVVHQFSHVAIPCAIASSIVTMVHTPLTIVVTLILAFALPVEMAGPVLVATVVASTLSSALVRSLDGATDSSDDSQHSIHEPSEEPLMNSDDELLNNVRTAIFGGA